MDAVSLTLAQNAAERAKQIVPEARLQYGFRKLPENQPEGKICLDIPEEKLATVDRNILELKTLTNRIVSDDFDVPTEDDDESFDNELDEIFEPNYLGYRDVGYGPERLREAKFVVQPLLSERRKSRRESEDRYPVIEGEVNGRENIDVDNNDDSQLFDELIVSNGQVIDERGDQPVQDLYADETIQ